MIYDPQRGTTRSLRSTALESLSLSWKVIKTKQKHKRTSEKRGGRLYNWTWHLSPCSELPDTGSGTVLPFYTQGETELFVSSEYIYLLAGSHFLTLLILIGL